MWVSSNCALSFTAPAATTSWNLRSAHQTCTKKKKRKPEHHKPRKDMEKKTEHARTIWNLVRLSHVQSQSATTTCHQPFGATTRVRFLQNHSCGAFVHDTWHFYPAQFQSASTRYKNSTALEKSWNGLEASGGYSEWSGQECPGFPTVFLTARRPETMRLRDTARRSKELRDRIRWNKEVRCQRSDKEQSFSIFEKTCCSRVA